MGGSLGHGTALPWKFDADIVIYSEGIYVQLNSVAPTHLSANMLMLSM